MIKPPYIITVNLKSQFNYKPKKGKKEDGNVYPNPGHRKTSPATKSAR
jgi:hypothetical protein